jgi:hypothetical protein
LYSTGASGAVPVRPIHAPNPVESNDRLGQGAIVREPDKPATTDQANRDWTLPEPAKAKEPKKTEEPPKEPLYKQLVEMIQSMWRASTMAVDMADTVTKAGQQERMAQNPPQESPTYADPKVKRSGGV